MRVWPIKFEVYLLNEVGDARIEYLGTVSTVIPVENDAESETEKCKLLGNHGFQLEVSRYELVEVEE